MEDDHMRAGHRPFPAAVVVAALLAAPAVLAAGCGQDPADDTARPPASTAPAAPSAGTSGPAAGEVTAITVTVTQGRVRTERRRVRVERGTRVRITVTSDVAEEFHLHGYDRTLTLRPARPATLELVADVPGVFEAELHGSGARLFELQVG
jgi:heme/copper-type cytochrome/quinol oxidase subunit 2